MGLLDLFFKRKLTDAEVQQLVERGGAHVDDLQRELGQRLLVRLQRAVESNRAATVAKAKGVPNPVVVSPFPNNGGSFSIMVAIPADGYTTVWNNVSDMAFQADINLKRLHDPYDELSSIEHNLQSAKASKKPNDKLIIQLQTRRNELIHQARGRAFHVFYKFGKDGDVYWSMEQFEDFARWCEHQVKEHEFNWTRVQSRNV